MTGDDSRHEPGVGPTPTEAAVVLDRTCAAIEDSLDALEILFTPDDALGGRAPIEILRSEPFAASVINKTLETFGDARKAARWLCRPTHLLDGLRPLELLGAEEGARRVETVLARIDYGVPP